ELGRGIGGDGGAAEADEHDKTTLRAVGFYVAQKMQRLKIGDRNRPHPMLFMLYSSRKVNTRDGVILPAWQIAGRHATQAERMTELVDALEAIVALATLDMDDKNAAAMLKSSQEVIQRMEASIQEYRKDAARHKQQIEVLRAELQHSRLQVRKLERACRQLMEQKAKLKDAIPRGQEPAVKQPKKNPANPTPARQRSRTGEAKKGRNGSDKGKAQCGTEKFANPIWTVTSVKDNVVAINAGSDAEVKKGMRLVIYRDNQFVGYLKVQQVSDNSAAGVIENAQRNVTVGDSVTAALPMGR
ncbi:MAG: hypothetical protein ACLFV7_11245, partial [Phycisphaerae bacterium]